MDNLLETYTDGHAFLHSLHASEEQMAMFDELSAAPPARPDADFMPMLQAGSVAWIFSFLKALDYACDACATDHERALKYLTLYIRIEEFLLEDTRFPSLFPEGKQAIIPVRAEQKLHEAAVRRKVLTLLRDGQTETFLADLADRTETPGIQLYRPERQAEVLAELFLHDPQALTASTTTYLRLFKHFAEQDPAIFPIDYWLDTCEAMVARECDAMDAALLTELITPEIRQRAEGLVRIAGATFLLCKAADREIDMVRRLMFYRYLCVLDERHLPPLKNLMLSTFLKHNSRPPEYTWDELIGFSLPTFVGKIAYFTENIPEDRRPYTFEGKGVVTLAERRITLAPFADPLGRRRMHKLLTLWDGSLRINSYQKPTADLTAGAADADLPAKTWEEAAGDFIKEKTIYLRHETKEVPPVGTQVKIRIKTMHPAYPSLAFASIEDDTYEGNGAIHVSQVSRIKLTSLADIFAEGDLVTARVIDTTDPKRMGFSILEEISNTIATRFHPGEYTYARLIVKNKNSYRWVSEKGYPLYTVPSPDEPEDLAPDDIYLLRLTNVNRTGYVRAVIEEEAPEGMEIDTEKAVGDLVSYYVDERLPEDELEEYDDKETPTDAEEEETAGTLDPEYLRQLIYLIDLYTESTSDHILRFNLCQTARLLAVMISSPELVAYYDQRIRYLTELHNYINSRPVNVGVISDEAVSRYPRLTYARTILSLLALRDDPEADIDTLREHMHSGRKQIADLARLLLIARLADKAYPDITTIVDAEVRSLLAIEVEEDPDGEAEEIDFGRETNTREFKSTIVFPPNNDRIPDVDRQMERILMAICGFLNAEGGILFIGVNDIGYPKGIEPDLTYLHANVDKYQLIIRNYIVKELGKDINGLIRFDFHDFSGKIVCAISVPAYHEVVFYRDIVWQRQGNSTRPLDLPDIRLLKERRKNLLPSRRITAPAFGDLKEQGESDVQKVFPVSIPTYTPAPPTKPRPNSKAERSAQSDEPDRIATSTLFALREQEATAYFSILRSGRFVITHEEPHRSDARITLPIYDDYLDGFLIYVYENGYANRIAVSTLLSKKVNYEYTNAMFDKSPLRFAAFVRPDDTLYLKVSSKSGDFIRTLAIQVIKLNTDLSLRGTPLYTIPFGRIVQVDILNEEQSHEVENIRSDVPTTLGTPAQSFSIIRTAMYLSNLLNGDR